MATLQLDIQPYFDDYCTLTKSEQYTLHCNIMNTMTEETKMIVPVSVHLSAIKNLATGISGYERNRWKVEIEKTIHEYSQDSSCVMECAGWKMFDDVMFNRDPQNHVEHNVEHNKQINIYIRYPWAGKKVNQTATESIQALLSSCRGKIVAQTDAVILFDAHTYEEAQVIRKFCKKIELEVTPWGES
jgi:hypothetical protein